MADLNGKRVAIIAMDHFEEVELVEPRDRLTDSGAQVRVYSADTGTIRAKQGDTQPGNEVPVDATMKELKLDDFDALVVPGGTVNADHLRMDRDAQRILREALEAGKPTAVICHGPWLLVNAGMAEGKRLTSFPSLEADLRNAGATWVDEPVVVDGQLITSRKPDDLPRFIGAIEDALTG